MKIKQSSLKGPFFPLSNINHSIRLLNKINRILYDKRLKLYYFLSRQKLENHLIETKASNCNLQIPRKNKKNFVHYFLIPLKNKEKQTILTVIFIYFFSEQNSKENNKSLL